MWDLALLLEMTSMGKDSWVLREIDLQLPLNGTIGHKKVQIDAKNIELLNFCALSALLLNNPRIYLLAKTTL